jgi:hypothetical protein
MVAVDWNWSLGRLFADLASPRERNALDISTVANLALRSGGLGAVGVALVDMGSNLRLARSIKHVVGTVTLG